MGLAPVAARHKRCVVRSHQSIGVTTRHGSRHERRQRRGMAARLIRFTCFWNLHRCWQGQGSRPWYGARALPDRPMRLPICRPRKLSRRHTARAAVTMKRGVSPSVSPRLLLAALLACKWVEAASADPGSYVSAMHRSDAFPSRATRPGADNLDPGPDRPTTTVGRPKDMSDASPQTYASCTQSASGSAGTDTSAVFCLPSRSRYICVLSATEHDFWLCSLCLDARASLLVRLLRAGSAAVWGPCCWVRWRPWSQHARLRDVACCFPDIPARHTQDSAGPCLQRWCHFNTRVGCATHLTHAKPRPLDTM